MASSSRPVRNKNQPIRNRDNVELNLELIERLEANRAARYSNQGNTNYAKVLATFINSINQQYRASLSKMETQKIDHGLPKKKALEIGDYSEWGTDKEKKRYGSTTGSKVSTRGVIGGKLQEEVKIDKANLSQQAKYGRTSKGANFNEIGANQTQNRNILKEQKKPAVLITPPPQPSNTIQKPFKRSSFHIGIAYNIYIDQFKQKYPNVTDPKQCDPTINAKKLRSEQLKAAEGQ